MSRSNPQDSAVNPSRRWFEWNGEQGTVRYYDKAKKENVTIDSGFTFILLDQLGGVRGWHEASKSGIYSNEVRDTRQDVLVVKAFKEGTLAQGLYKDIKDRVNSVGGYFVANCYVAFKTAEGSLDIGAIRFKGSALGAWMEFTKQHRGELYEQAIVIDGVTEGQKGRVKFKTPTFALKPLSNESNLAAIALDKQLQTFLAAYLGRTKTEQVTHTAETSYDDPPPHDDVDDYTTSARDIAPDEDDIPF